MGAELIRPVQTDARKRRLAAGFAAVTGVVLVVLAITMVAVLQEQRAATLSNEAGSLEAQTEAKKAEVDVATFLAAMKAQKEVPKHSDSHALDWNWAPELARNKSVKNWVGSQWVRPLAGDREIKQISPPKFGLGKDRLAAAKNSEGLAAQITGGKLHMPQMPALKPLHFFPGGVRSDWSTRDAITRAKHMVHYVQKAVMVDGQQLSHTSEPVVKEPKLAVHTSTAPHKDAEAQAKVTVKSAAIQDSPNSKSSVLIPDSVVAQEKALQAQISQLQSSIAKAKKA